jgi:hypothetical protein
VNPAELLAAELENLLAQGELRKRREAEEAARVPPVPTFRGANLEAQTIEAHEWILSGPAETGKTWATLYRLDSLARSTVGAKGVLVRKVRSDMDTTVLSTWHRLIEGRQVEKIGGDRPTAYRYANGTTVHVVGMDREGKVLSGEFDWICVNQCEELWVADWETLSSRCTGRGARTSTPMLFGDCNPGPPTHWIRSRPALKLLYSTHRDNPSLYDEGGNLTRQGERTMEVLGGLTGVRRERLFLGRWVAAEGTVYAFDRSMHLVPRFEVPRGWRYVAVVDFGYTNPFVWQLWAIDHDGRAFLVREIYRTRRLVEDHAIEIRQLTRGLEVEATVTDHDAEDRATLEKHLGCSTTAASKAIQPGIQAVQARLAPAGDGRPRLFVMEGALTERDEALVAAHKPVCTADEFEGYVWPRGGDGAAVKEVPVKVNDHGMDAVRYLAMYLDEHESVGLPALIPPQRRRVEG